MVAAAGTIFLAWYLGRPPWIAITLAISFGIYGLVRKRLDVGPMLGMLWETALMFLPAVVYLTWLSSDSTQQFMNSSLGIDMSSSFTAYTWGALAFEVFIAIWAGIALLKTR